MEALGQARQGVRNVPVICQGGSAEPPHSLLTFLSIKTR